MVYQVEIDRPAQRDIKVLLPNIAKRIVGRIRTLENNPFPRGNAIKKLEGYKDLYRLRVGDYRVVFLLEGKTVRVKMVCHRRDVYLRLRNWR